MQRASNLKADARKLAYEWMCFVRTMSHELPLRSCRMAGFECHELLDLEGIRARTGRFTVPETGP
jgi:hypothetical protein